jgi:hypothetical protein
LNLLLAKLILTPLMIGAAIWVARRWGDSVGGWLAGLPLTSAPIVGFLAIEHGPAFAATASAGSIAGVACVATFCLAYAAASGAGWALGFLAGTLGYAVCACVLQALEPPPIVLIAIAVCALALARFRLPRPTRVFLATRALPWEIPLRLALVTALVVGVTSLASALGPRASGATASFPWIGGALAAFAHRAQGADAGVAVLRGFALALYGFLVFFAVLGFALTRVDLPFAFLAATVAALGIQLTTLRLVRGEARRER